MENIKGNPVPSIDNLLKQYINYRDSDIMEGVECGNILAFIYFLKYNNLHGKRFISQKECKERFKELQNGVETDNEQPICTRCKRPFGTLCLSCNI